MLDMFEVDEYSFGGKYFLQIPISFITIAHANLFLCCSAAMSPGWYLYAYGCHGRYRTRALNVLRRTAANKRNIEKRDSKLTCYLG